MSDPRHFTVVDDLVMLHPDVNATEFRVYSIIKGNLRHTYGGVPETGFRATANWVSKVSNGLISVSTAHRAMQGLASKGVLHRLNDPNKSGEGADFEFVVHPDKSYGGCRSVMTKAAELEKTQTRSVSFSVVPLSGKPSSGIAKRTSRAPVDLSMDEMGMGMLELPYHVVDEASEPDELADEILDEVLGRTTPEMAAFALELEALTGRLADVRLRLMEGACQRVAEAVRPALELGWDPKVLARRLASELNSKIHSPEKLLLTKAKDIGAPQRVAAPAAKDVGEDALRNFVPRRNTGFPRKPPVDPDDEAKKEALLREYQAKREKAKRLGKA